MSRYITPESYAKKVSALKHINKVISQIDKTGEAIICLGCTGAKFTAYKGDAVYLRLLVVKAQHEEDVSGYEITKKYQKRNALPTASSK
jgi:hypothetical protein